MKSVPENLVRQFINAFEEVFDRDWPYTREMLGVWTGTMEQVADADDITYVIAPNGTFLNPNVEDEGEDWGNRAVLLRCYRELKKQLQTSSDVTGVDQHGAVAKPPSAVTLRVTTSTCRWPSESSKPYASNRSGVSTASNKQRCARRCSRKLPEVPPIGATRRRCQ